MCAFVNDVLDAAKALGWLVARVLADSPHAVAILLCLSRHVHKADNRLREVNFSIDGFTGSDVRGATVGVVGTRIIRCIHASNHVS